MTIPCIGIEEVLGRMEQGQTLPFICRGSDGHNYVVKGRYAGRRSLIAELLCGQLAQGFGLKTAPFAIVDVPQALMQPIFRPDIQELGAGLAFGSQQLPHVQDLSMAQLQAARASGAISERLARDVFMFDLWLCNGDRTLTKIGGNPNLLWNYAAQQLVVIDHNCAFDKAFSVADALALHVFAAAGRAVFDDLAEKAHYLERFELALAGFEAACDNVPLSWWWVDDGVPAQFDRQAAATLLARFHNDAFWKEL